MVLGIWFLDLIYLNFPTHPYRSKGSPINLKKPRTMADSTPVLPEPITDTGTYRPLSGFAMASFVIAAFYALIVSAFALISFFSGTPIFLPVWGLVVPLVAIILAGIGRRQIRTSEGSRSGLALANWGWWLGLGFGIVHGGIYMGTMLAVGMQAQAELKANFFDKIHEGNLEDAFFFTIGPDQRSNREEMLRRFPMIEAGKKGAIARFKEHDIVHILQQAGTGSTTESLGIKSINPQKDGYNVMQDYRITTPEGVYVIQFTLRTKDSKDSRKRRWQLVWKETDTLVVSWELTALGQNMQKWKQTAREFAANWVMARSVGRIDLAYLDTCPPEVRDQRKRQYQVAKMAATLACTAAALGSGNQALPMAPFGVLADVRLGCELCMPGFHQFSSGDILDKKEFSAAKNKTQMLAEFQENFLRPNDLGFRPEGDLGVIRRVEGDSPHLQALITFEIALKGGDGPKYMGAAELVVETDRIPEGEPGLPQWRVASIKLLAGGPPPSAGPPGMPSTVPEMMGLGQRGGRLGAPPPNDQ
jgi:hypothetical protein